MRAFILSDMNSPSGQAIALPFLFKGEAIDSYHSLMRQVQDGAYEMMRVLEQGFDCILHEPVNLSQMLTLYRKWIFLYIPTRCVNFVPASFSPTVALLTSRWVTSLLLDVSKVCRMTLCSDNTLLKCAQSGVQGHRLAWTRLWTPSPRRTGHGVTNSKKSRTLQGRWEKPRALQFRNPYP